MHSYVLVLSWLNEDWTNLSGIKIPEYGYVEDPGFSRSRTVLNGLHGTLWGQNQTNQWLTDSPDKPWVVIRTEKNDEIVKIDTLDNFVKFKGGTVVRSGSYYECISYILNCLDNM